MKAVALVCFLFTIGAVAGIVNSLGSFSEGNPEANLQAIGQLFGSSALAAVLLFCGVKAWRSGGEPKPEKSGWLIDPPAGVEDKD